MKKLAVNSEKAPAAIGPYSHANIAGDLVFVSGQLPVKEGKLITDDIGEATKACMENIRLILEAAGSSLDKCLKCTIYLCNLGDFGKVNEATLRRIILPASVSRFRLCPKEQLWKLLPLPANKEKHSWIKNSVNASRQSWCMS